MGGNSSGTDTQNPMQTPWASQGPGRGIPSSFGSTFGSMPFGNASVSAQPFSGSTGQVGGYPSLSETGQAPQSGMPQAFDTSQQGGQAGPIDQMPSSVSQTIQPDNQPLAPNPLGIPSKILGLPTSGSPNDVLGAWTGTQNHPPVQNYFKAMGWPTTLGSPDLPMASSFLKKMWGVGR